MRQTSPPASGLSTQPKPAVNMEISAAVGPAEFSDAVRRSVENADFNGTGSASSPIAVSKKLLKCDFDGCGKSFPHLSKLERHKQQRHDAIRIKAACSNCGKHVVELS